MLGFKSLEHYDEFGKDIVFWIDVSSVPKKFMEEAKAIDSENYSGDCFGVCMHYDGENKEFSAVEDEPGRNLYYVDNNGNKHWFPYVLNQQEQELMAENLKPVISRLAGSQTSI